jgi:hypothetical protein
MEEGVGVGSFADGWRRSQEREFSQSGGAKPKAKRPILSLFFFKQHALASLDTPARINLAETEKPGAAGLSFARHSNSRSPDLALLFPRL